MHPDPGTAYRLLSENVQRVIQGEPEVVRMAIVALFAEGRLLIEDVEGVVAAAIEHRLVLTPEVELNRVEPATALRGILDATRAPAPMGR